MITFSRDVSKVVEKCPISEVTMLMNLQNIPRSRSRCRRRPKKPALRCRYTPEDPW